MSVLAKPLRGPKCALEVVQVNRNLWAVGWVARVVDLNELVELIIANHLDSLCQGFDGVHPAVDGTRMPAVFSLHVLSTYPSSSSSFEPLPVACIGGARSIRYEDAVTFFEWV